MSPVNLPHICDPSCDDTCNGNCASHQHRTRAVDLPIATQVTDYPDQLPLLFANLNLPSLPRATRELIAMVDACLPQTQCGLCEHPDGCLPYAHAIVTQQQAHNRCVPGGQPVADAIADMLQRDHLPATASVWAVNSHTQRPQEVRAIIDEADCIGCTKCIPACPVDAIIGTGKHMHTIFTDLCTGCELCLPPCPVDCIRLVPIEHVPSPKQRHQQQAQLRQRYHTHLQRVTGHMQDRHNAMPVVSMVQAKLDNVVSPSIEVDASTAKSTIAAAKLRSKIKKLHKQLEQRDSNSKQAELHRLEQQLKELSK